MRPRTSYKSSMTLHQRISTWSILDMVENKLQKRQPCPSSCLRSVASMYRRIRPSRRRPQGSGPVLIPARLPQRTPRHSAEPDVIDPAGDAVRVRQPGQGTYFSIRRAELESFKLLSSYNWRDLKRYRKKKKWRVFSPTRYESSDMCSI